MKILHNKLMFLFLILYSITIHAQGIIKGFAVDSLTSDKLKGVEIFLLGTAFGMASDVNGEFTLRGIPPGRYKLHAYYMGYEAKIIPVNIQPGETLVKKIELIPTITLDDGAVLTTQAESQAEEINLQLASNNVKNVIGTLKLGDMPDENILMTLSRLPGAAIEYRPYYPPVRESGGWAGNELASVPDPPGDDFPMMDDPVSKVLIRGLDSRFYNINVDGVRIAPSAAKDKSVDLNIFSAGNFQNIELSKTVTSDEDGDATAGSVNIISGNAPDKRFVKAEISGNYNGLDISTNQYNFTGSYGERFLDNSLGIQAGASAEKKYMSNEFLGGDALYGPTLSYENIKRKKYSGNILLDIITPEGGSIKFNNIYTSINYKSLNHIDKSLNSTGVTERDFVDKETDQRIFISSITGHNHLLGFDINWSAAYSDSKNDHPFYYGLSFFSTPSSQGYSSFWLDYTQDSHSKNYSKEKTASIDISKKYGINNEITGEFKIGGKYRADNRIYDEYLLVESASLRDEYQYITLADGSKVLKDFSGTRFNGLVGKMKGNIKQWYFQGSPPRTRKLFDEYSIPLYSEDELLTWRMLNHNQFNPNEGPGINSYNFSGSVLSAYVMHQMNFGQAVKLITGCRIESEHNSYYGYNFPENFYYLGDLYNLLPERSKTYKYDKVSVLPNLHLILKPTGFLNIRLAAYKSLIRPDYNARIPKYFSLSQDAYSQYVTMGNPYLKNADVWNYEFQTQYYGNTVGLLGINAFYKDIKGMQKPIYGMSLYRTNVIESLGIDWWKSIITEFPFTDRGYTGYAFYNSPEPTRIWGLEIEHHANLKFLPGPLKNLVLDYNFSFIRTETWEPKKLNIVSATYIDSVYFKADKLKDIPAFFANIIFGYDIGSLSLRISYYYQDRYNIMEDYFQDPIMGNKFSRVDVALKQQMSESISLFLIVNNLKKFEEKAEVVGDVWGTRDTKNYRTGMNYSFGIRAEF